jgi:hypothetical protein
MQITRSSLDTPKGPAARLVTDDVHIDAVTAPEATSTFAAASVHFTPGTAPRPTGSWFTSPCSKATSPAAQSRGAST